MSIDPVYLCKDCKFSKLGTTNMIMTFGGLVGVKDFMYKCSKSVTPAREIIDPVTGPTKVKASISFCSIERKHGDCGPTAKFWIPKRKKDLFKMLTKEHNNAD